MDFDVVVVGASSAGLYAAELLANSGRRVALLEKQPGISAGARTYIITPGLFRVFPDLDRSLIRHRIETFQLNAAGQRAEVHLQVPDLVIDRRQLLENLVRRARSAGVELHFGSQFEGFTGEENQPGLKIRKDGKEEIITTDFLIGADGVNSQVREGADLPAVGKIPLLQAEVQLPEEWDDRVCGIWFDVSDTGYFYWLIPDRDRRGAAGLIAEPGSDIRYLLDQFLQYKGLKALRYQSGQAALHAPGARLEARKGKTRIMLVGDAAGQVKVTTVGGCVTGFAGSKAAAAAIEKGITYQQASRELNAELYLHHLIRKLLDKMSGCDYEQLVGYLNPAVQSFLSEKNRDQMGREFWKLVFLQPRFIPLGLRLLFR